MFGEIKQLLIVSFADIITFKTECFGQNCFNCKKINCFYSARRGIRERDHSFYLVTLRRIFFYFGFKKTLARCKTTEKNIYRKRFRKIKSYSSCCYQTSKQTVIQLSLVSNCDDAKFSAAKIFIELIALISFCQVLSFITYQVYLLKKILIVNAWETRRNFIFFVKHS